MLSVFGNIYHIYFRDMGYRDPPSRASSVVVNKVIEKLCTSLACLLLYIPVYNFSVVLEGFPVYLLSSGYSRTQRSDSIGSESLSSNPLIPSLMLYQLSSVLHKILCKNLNFSGQLLDESSF